MKKFFKTFFLLILIAGAGIIAYIFFIEPSVNYQSVYLVPENAAFIIETEQPFEAWETIVHSKAWNNLRSNEFLARLDTSIRSLDSLISSKRALFKLFGSRKIMISAHQYGHMYDFLFIVDLKKISKFKDINKYLQKILGDDFRLTQTEHKGFQIYELYDKDSREMYYFSLVRNQLIFSKNALLLDSSIDQMKELVIGRDLNYIQVARKVSGRGLFNIYINYKYFVRYIENLMGRTNEFMSSLSGSLYYSGITFDIDEDALIKLTGFTTVNDTVSSYFLAVLNSGKGSKNILDITPKRAASYVCIGFDDMMTFYENLENSLGEDIVNEYRDAIQKVEKSLKINIRENFFGWIDDEIAIIQTQPSNLGKENEYAVVIKAKNRHMSQRNLDYINKQIRKNTPVKFKEVDYKGYTINYLHIPGFFRMILGKLLERLEKPYYTIIDRYVIFSNHPQTLKSMVDDYESGSTLANSVEFHNFSKNFSSKSSVFLYIQTPLFLNNLKEFASPEAWAGLQKNKEYINAFPQVGFQVNTADDLLKLELAAQFFENVEDFAPVRYGIETTEPLAAETVKPVQKSDSSRLSGESETMESVIRESEIIVDDLDASRHEEYYESGRLKLTVGLKNGLKHGSFKEYYENGTLKVRGRYKDDRKSGKWSYYDEQGELMEEKIY
jgi:hypothetical protein